MKRTNLPDHWSVNLAIEDKFAIFGLDKPNGLLPEQDLLDGLIASFYPLRNIYVPLLDLGNVSEVTSDILDFVEAWSDFGAKVIVDRTNLEYAEQWPRQLAAPIQVERRPWQQTIISLAHFADGEDVRTYSLAAEIRATLVSTGDKHITDEEWDVIRRFAPGGDFRPNWTRSAREAAYPFSADRYQGGAMDVIDAYAAGMRALGQQVKSIGRNSLMTQLALIPGAMETVHAVPFHGQALFQTDQEANGSLIVARPEIIAHRTAAIFGDELKEFTSLLSDPSVSEGTYQRFFEKHDSFFRMLGFKALYPKVVLERDDGTSLQPDFMVEPFDRDFWDVLDIKRPDAPVVVGGRDRKDFSAQVHQLGAQLREYGAYFDEEKNRKRVADRYGINAYKPRLIGIIGDHHDVDDKLQLQRVMTQYKDTRIMTFGQLHAMAKDRLLI